MNKEYLCKMLALLEHKEINSIINNKNSYLVVVSKLSNYDEYKEHIETLLNENYALISNNVNNLSTKLIHFLKDIKIQEYLKSKNIITYSLIYVDIDYLIQKLFPGWRYEIFDKKVMIYNDFNFQYEADLYYDSLTSKKKSIEELCHRFNLKYLLVFTLNTINTKNFIIDTTTHGNLIEKYALESINDNLIDFEDDVVVLGVTADESWKLKKTAIINSKEFLLQNVYSNFSDLKVTLCDYEGKFLDELGETLVEVGYILSPDKPVEKNNNDKLINKTDICKKDNVVVKEDYSSICVEKIKSLNDIYNKFMTYLKSGVIFLTEDLKIDRNKTEEYKIKDVPLKVKKHQKKFNLLLDEINTIYNKSLNNEELIELYEKIDSYIDYYNKKMAPPF